MRLLVIGGTRFVGRHAVDAALAAGHDVTLFNRGVTAEPPAGTTLVRGDRDIDGDLAPLTDGAFDAVLDCCAYAPDQVARLADALGERFAGRYLLISSISVHGGDDPPIPVGVTEDDPVVPAVYPDGPGERYEDYGGKKVACEQVAADRFARTSVVRPGLVVGPHDHTGRFTYWVDRLADGGRVLCPGRPDRPAQVVDARDLARFVVHLLEADTGGTYNTVAPPVPFGDLLGEVATAVGSDGELVWVDDDALLDAGVTPWVDLPVWLPAALAGMLAARPDRAVAARFTPRPIGATAADLLAWTVANPPAPVTGIDRAREAELLATLAPG